MSTFQRLRKILSEQLGISELLITRESRLADLLGSSGGDSLPLIEFTMAIEEEFDLSAPSLATDSSLHEVQAETIGELADRLDKYRV